MLAGAGAGRADAASKRFPGPLGYVSDFAEIVDAASADSITTLATELREKTGAELAVVTLRDLGGDEIDPAATALFKEWGVGRAGEDDGVLILLALAERKVRIEPGYANEGVLPDGRCGAIIRRVMGPDLSAGRYGPGLLAGARAVAGAIAAEKGVTITGSIDPSAEGASTKEAPAWVLLVVFIMLVLLASAITRMASRLGGRGPYRDWRMGGRGPHDPWGGFGGGWGGMGGFGGGGGGGGGGGFGGFGGGRSGGGGASGGF
ncbi:MAG TPA: TPM domain-containing protein [Candidatus Eisenbacteria bacterium]|nr:TPM domain-containing protein [Candidatus Eisenbacteria bacterium]